MKTLNSLKISECFFSIQCEGISTGYPAYFVRLTDCNLSCGASQRMVNQMRKNILQETPGDFQGDLHASGEATWTCDTIPVWIKGEEKTFQWLIDKWKEEGVYEDICSGIIHIIWTGGEPTIKYHQEAIINFNKYLVVLNGFKSPDIFAKLSKVYQEIETNGTIYIEDDLFRYLNQINCSAKLSNSGMSEKKRIIPDAIKRIMKHPNYSFKFVISTEDDIKEFMETYVKPFNIPIQKVVCMPGLDSQENFHERTRFVLEMAKKYKFIGLTRLHVSAWDRTTGV